MFSVRADYPTEWPHVNLYVLADLHIGDEHAKMTEIAARVEEIRNDPYGLCILNGDILNTALKTSVSDIYSEQMSPMQQMEAASVLLAPIKDKVIAATTGNHEARVYRTDGVDIMRLLCRELGLEDKYHADGVADSSNCCARKVEKLFVNTGASLEYGGYGQAQEFKPSSTTNPVIHFCAEKKRTSATL